MKDAKQQVEVEMAMKVKANKRKRKEKEYKVLTTKDIRHPARMCRSLGGGATTSVVGWSLPARAPVPRLFRIVEFASKRIDFRRGMRLLTLQGPGIWP